MRQNIETEKLRLRCPNLPNAGVLVTIGNDYSIARNVASLPHPFTLGDATTMIGKAHDDWTSGEGQYFLVVERAVGRIAGVAGVSMKSAPVFELSYWIGAPFQGSGLATEAARALIEMSFKDCGAKRLIAWHGRDNPASRRVQEKLGMRFLGSRGMVFSLGRGELVPCRLMELSKEEYRPGSS